MTIENKNLEVFMNLFGLECLIKKPTCFQSKNKSCIALILTNKKDFFENSNVLEVGILDHLEKSASQRSKTKLCRDYSEFNMDNFKAEQDDKLKNGYLNKVFKFSKHFYSSS